MSSPFKKQLKELQAIAFDAESKKAKREWVMSRIEARVPSPSRAQSANMIFQAIFPWRNFANFSRSFGTLAVAGMVVLGGSIATVGAAKGSLPGDRLYSLKLASEQVQLALTTDEVKRIRFQLEITENRMNELQRMTAQENTKKQRSNIEDVAKSLTKEIRAVKDSVAKVSATNAAVATSLAQEVTDKTKGYEQTLKETNVKLTQTAQEDAPPEEATEAQSGEAKAAVEEAARAASFTSTDALRVLIYRDKTDKVKVDGRQIQSRLETEIKDMASKYEFYSQSYTEEKQRVSDFLKLITEIRSAKESVDPEHFWRKPDETQIAALKSSEEELKRMDWVVAESIMKDFTERELVYLWRLYNDSHDYKKLIDEILKAKYSEGFLEDHLNDRKVLLESIAAKLADMKASLLKPLPPVEEKKEEEEEEVKEESKVETSASASAEVAEKTETATVTTEKKE